VKIRGTCRSCRREFFVEQVIENGGHCPWCGEVFQSHYAAVLVESLRAAEAAGNNIDNALEKVADMTPGFTLDKDSVLSRLRAHLERLEAPRG